MTIFLNHKTDTISPGTLTFNGLNVTDLNIADALSTITYNQTNRHLRVVNSTVTIPSGFTKGTNISLYNSLTADCILTTPLTYSDGIVNPTTVFVLPPKSTAVFTCISDTEYVITGLKVYPLTISGAPTAVTAAAGNAKATVTFTPPVNTGGTTITSYTVTSSGGQIATGTTPPIDVTGLTPGGSYTFTVTATNIAGTSVASSASSSITVWSVPGAPTAVSATAGIQQASVAFTPPASTGGTTISYYTVTSSGGQIATGISSPIVVPGLAVDSSYTFSVTATNVVGTSPASTASSSLTIVDKDPYWSNVALLLKGEGGTLTDSSPYNRSISGLNVTATNIFGGVFGNGCISVANGYISIPINATLAFGYTFTVEFWVYNSAGPTSNAIYVSESGGSINVTQLANLGNIYFGNFSTSPFSIPSSKIGMNTWHHVAISSGAAWVTVYVDGVSQGQFNMSLGASDGGTLYFGGRPNNYVLSGLYDEIRVTPGIQRYTANFTPPTRTFPTQ